MSKLDEFMGRFIIELENKMIFLLIYYSKKVMETISKLFLSSLLIIKIPSEVEIKLKIITTSIFPYIAKT